MDLLVIKENTDAMLYTIFLLLLTSMNVAQETTTFDENQLIGTWVLDDYQTDRVIYTKQNDFQKDAPGVQFGKKGQLLKRQNIGWCGTPPITYGNDKGTWSKTADQQITIEYQFWGGTSQEDWTILSVDKETLVVKVTDRRNLKE